MAGEREDDAMDQGEILEDIQDGIRAELEATPESYAFQIAERMTIGALWSLVIEPAPGNRSGVDESLEEAMAWWPEPQRGAADVLAVLPELHTIYLRHATLPPPEPGGVIFLYPPRYLERLAELWNVTAWANRAIAAYETLQAGINHAGGINISPSLPWLRSAQQQAFLLFRHKFGFLWGPPGTGKTTTVGAMLADFLVSQSAAKVLLLSTTNVAVDIALVAVDKALEEVGNHNASAHAIRRNCYRIGNHFVASHYEQRRHLIPTTNTELIVELARLEVERPDKEDAVAYLAWRERVEHVRAEIRRQALDTLRTARVAAMTTTRAVFSLHDLVALGPYDLVVFDEASQVGRAYALALLPLAKRVLFAGDPRQLWPIVQAESDRAKRWLGLSVFEHMKEDTDSTVLLDEQSRMAEPICRIVSDVFYRGRLRLAEDARRDPTFHRNRELCPVGTFGTCAICVHRATTEGTWSRNYGGPIRYNTAQEIVGWVEQFLTHLEPKDILVLTPFRAQRAIIRQALRVAGIRRVAVSTVHRAQGSERHTVIFDPAVGDSPFLQTDDARRLVNVAISRAQARLIMVLSPGDRRNPLFQEIGARIEAVDGPLGVFEPIHRYSRRTDFPRCMLGKDIQIGEVCGTVEECFEGDRRFRLRDASTGMLRTYVTDHFHRSTS